MKITLPGGLKPLDVKNYGQFKSLAPYGRVGVWDFDNPNFITVTFDSHCNNPPPVDHPYILVGASSDPADIYNPETMADAWFTVPANENMNNLILSTADIIFTNKSNCSVNAPVTTNIGIAEFSNCCNCTKKKICGCKKTKKKFWNWLFCKKC